jgi:hypothetical protein
MKNIKRKGYKTVIGALWFIYRQHRICKKLGIKQKYELILPLTQPHD